MNNLDRMIEILCEEFGESPPSLPENQKHDFFRALCNERPPLPASEEFIRLQDEYLSSRTRLRGIVDINNFDYERNVSVWQGDITRLNSDAIVNACNRKLLGCFQPLHNCIDNVIHSNAGVLVRYDCNQMLRGKDEPNGRVRVTKAYNLPSKFIFHTVGAIVRGEVTRQNQTDLQNCYLSCLDKAAEMRLESIAFCCISTGVYGYPKDKACVLATQTVKNWQDRTLSNLKIIFNVFTDEDKQLYERELSKNKTAR